MMKKIAQSLFMVIGLFAFGSGMAQDDSDMKAVLGFEPTEVLETWKEWEQSPTKANAYVGEFMKTHPVPQNGDGLLNKHDAWLSWIGNHPDLIRDELLHLEGENQ
jgi:hypothetical protein